jgi:MoxR-like ATPase
MGVMLTGPTGCGKTRLVRHVSADLGRSLITVSCHDDLSASDLLGRYLVVGGDVRWVDGPLTTAVRHGVVCHLDEVAEARRDTLAVLHSVLDDRRELYLDRSGESIVAAEGFALMASYNPESRSLLKELKPSFRHRFVTIEVDYLPPRARNASRRPRIGNLRGCCRAVGPQRGRIASCRSCGHRTAVDAAAGGRGTIGGGRTPTGGGGPRWHRQSIVR